MTSPTPENPFRWGLLAAGGIAHSFARDLTFLPEATIVAVGARAQESADAFGEEFDVPTRYGSYAELVADPDIEAVYISTLHPGHHDAALLAIAAGKPVLCEKPFMMDAAESSEVIAAARARGTFLMEAMWTRHLPDIVRVREIVASGVLGEIVTVTAEHGQWFPHDPEHRIFAPAKGGGALLDLGIYPVSFASMVLGAPSRVTAVSDPAFTGVDANTSIILQYPGGAHAILNTTSYALTGNMAAINGTDARIEIAGTFYRPSTFRVLDRKNAMLEEWTQPHEGGGLRHQAAEVGRRVRAGELESPRLPLDETQSIMVTMDEIRAQIGLTY
jgi:predicted dehydrogenase